MKILTRNIGILFIFIVLCTMSVFAISSSNYNINYYAISSGGGRTNSTNYNSNSIVGTIAGTTNSSNYKTYLGFFFGGSSSSSQSNSPPTITLVSNTSIGTVNPVAGSLGGIAYVTVWFEASDSNGVGDFNNLTSTATFSMAGEFNRTNASCRGVNNIDTITRNFSCTVGMLFYDATGTWTINVSINDSVNNNAHNDTTSFFYSSLPSFNISVTSLAWAGLSPNTFNITAGNSINATNDGNGQIMNYSIKAFDLLKNGTGPSLIGSGNFSALNQSSCTIGQKTILINNTDVNMTSNVTTYVLYKGKNVTNIYWCLDVPAGLGTGIYNTTNQWVITKQ